MLIALIPLTLSHAIWPDHQLLLAGLLESIQCP